MKKIKIAFDKKININQESSFQGFLIKSLDILYAEKLHKESLRPYSQFLENISDKGVWWLSLYDKEAEENILPII